ncbi:EamA family transporter [Vibrio sp. JC009]|uniref:DMT family transporter n=1 Tax=Vibrio sp. JC009 TaxID=2912314 RepID=UPI0023B0ABAE|nr:EamA family transporter [Vibrio sp. JC009]WED23678.1 EamA family transporter [Vibrio sp. JC009]
MLKNNASLSGVISIVVACVFWGTTGTAASFTPNVSPLATGAFSMGIGGVLLVISSLKHLFRDKERLLSQPKMLLAGGLSVAAYPLAFYSSMRLSGVAIGTVVSIASAPFFTVLLERLISKKTISLQWIISFIFGGLGIVFLTAGKQSESGINPADNTLYWGILLGLIAGLTYATYSWAARQMIEKGISSNSSMASMFGIAALFLLPSLMLTGDNLLTGPVNTAVAIYMAVIPMFLGYICFGFALRHIEASKATLITLLEPAIATIFAITIVGEKFYSIGWIGMLFIGICLVLQVVKLPAKTKESDFRRFDDHISENF